METPYFKYDLFKEDFMQVYQPAEDSFLMLDALQNDINFIMQQRPVIVLEVGCGSGILITALIKKLKHCLFIGTDINFLATETSLKCAKENGAENMLQVVNTNLVDGLSENLTGNVNLILFNPPYVPTEDREIESTGIIRSWAGGIKGRRIIDRFINNCLHLISKNGLLYLLLIHENEPEEVKKILINKGFSCETIISRKVQNEFQQVIRCIKK